LVRNVHFKQAARKHRPVNQHYFIFQILTEKKSLPLYIYNICIIALYL